MPGEATGTPASYRDLPEWKAAQAEYIGEDDPDDAEAQMIQRVRAAVRMHEIEKAFEVGDRLTGEIIGYLIGGKVYHPADVTIVRAGP